MKTFSDETGTRLASLNNEDLGNACSLLFSLSEVDRLKTGGAMPFGGRYPLDGALRDGMLHVFGYKQPEAIAAILSALANAGLIANDATHFWITEAGEEFCEECWPETISEINLKAMTEKLGARILAASKLKEQGVVN